MTNETFITIEKHSEAYKLIIEYKKGFLSKKDGLDPEEILITMLDQALNINNHNTSLEDKISDLEDEISDLEGKISDLESLLDENGIDY